jgi:YggT family protein
MNAFTEIGIYLIQTVANIYLLFVLVRFLLQLCKANFYNPISQFVVKVTAPPIGPLQKVFPSFNNFNSACVMLAIIVQMMAIQGSAFVYSGSLVPLLSMLIWSVLGIATLLLNIYFYGLLIVIVLSWVAPQSRHPAIALLWQLMEPIMAPFRKLIPPLGGLDLSPILMFMLLNVLRILVRNLAHSAQLPPLFVPGIM